MEKSVAGDYKIIVLELQVWLFHIFEESHSGMQDGRKKSLNGRRRFHRTIEKDQEINHHKMLLSETTHSVILIICISSKF